MTHKSVTNMTDDELLHAVIAWNAYGQLHMDNPTNPLYQPPDLPSKNDLDNEIYRRMVTDQTWRQGFHAPQG